MMKTFSLSFSLSLSLPLSLLLRLSLSLPHSQTWYFSLGDSLLRLWACEMSLSEEKAPSSLWKPLENLYEYVLKGRFFFQGWGLSGWLVEGDLCAVLSFALDALVNHLRNVGFLFVFFWAPVLFQCHSCSPVPFFFFFFPGEECCRGKTGLGRGVPLWVFFFSVPVELHCLVVLLKMAVLHR